MLLFGSVVYMMMAGYLINRTSFELEEEFDELKRAVEHAQNNEELQTVLAREFAHHPSFDFEVRGQQGTVLFHSDRLQKLNNLSADLLQTNVPIGGKADINIPHLGDFTVGCKKVASSIGELTLYIAIPLASQQQELSMFAFMLLCAGLLTIVCAIAGGYFLARSALSPVQRITQLAQGITAERLNERLPEMVVDDELGQLTNTLNEMIERLEKAFCEIQQFSGDAAHELRTPLSVMRSRVEIALRSERSPEEYKDVLEDVLDESLRLSQLIEQLLFLLREEKSGTTQDVNVISVGEIIKDVVTHVGEMIDQKGISLDLSKVDTWPVDGNSLLLSQAYFNILENAVKYTPTSGTIKIDGYADQKCVHINVADDGPGIPEDDLPNIFRRFYRADESRCRESGGTGLGLAIVKRIIELHHGTIEVNSEVPMGQVSKFPCHYTRTERLPSRGKLCWL